MLFMFKLLIPIVILLIGGYLVWASFEETDEERYMRHESFMIDCEIVKTLLSYGYEYYLAFRELYNEATFYRLMTLEQQNWLLKHIRKYFQDNKQYTLESFKKWIYEDLCDGTAYNDLEQKIEYAKERIRNLSMIRKMISTLKPPDEVLVDIQNKLQYVKDPVLKEQLEDIIRDVKTLPKPWADFVITEFISNIPLETNPKHLNEILRNLRELIESYQRSVKC